MFWKLLRPPRDPSPVGPHRSGPAPGHSGLGYLKGRLLKAVERTLSCDSASNSKVEKRVKDTSDSSEAHNSEALGPSGHFASDLAMIGQV